MLMGIQITMVVISLIYLIIITTLFFTKEKIKNNDTEIYKKMIIISIVSIMSEIMLFLSGGAYFKSGDMFKFLFLNFSKVFVCVVITWFVYMTKYTFLLSDINREVSKTDSSNDKYKKLFNIINIILVLEFVIVMISPVDFVFDRNLGGYTTGPATKVAFVFIVLACLTMFVNFFRAHKKISSKEFAPIIILLILMTIATFVQATNPQILLFNPVIVIVMSIMYHTIENPDIKMIVQLEYAKEQAEKANRSKSDFLSSMSH